MRTAIWNGRWLLVATLAIGCPSEEEGDSGTESDTEGSTGTTAPTSSTTMATMTSTSASTSSTTDPSSSEVTGDPGTGTMGESSDSSGETTGKVDPCAELGREECSTTEGCLPIQCSGYEMTPQGATPWCLGEPEFIGCHSTDVTCTAEPTVTCESKDGRTFRCRDDCIPAAFMVCDPPVDGDVPGCMG